MDANRERLKQMRLNAKRKAHKASIHHRPRGITVKDVKEPIKIIDLDKKVKPAPKEKPGIARRLFRRLTGNA